MMIKQETCKASAGLFKVLSDKFKPQHNKITLSLQYRQAHKRSNMKMPEEWMGHNRIEANECSYKEQDSSIEADR